MSLSVYLHPIKEIKCECGRVHYYVESEELFWKNITHNLTKMAKEAGIYRPMWHPSELGITTASQLIEPLEAGLKVLESDPDKFRKYDSPNGWGRYENLVSFVKEYLAACKEYPDAEVSAYG